MKSKLVSLTLITLLAFFYFVPIFQAPSGTLTAKAGPAIVIDGDISDWADVAPVATDPVGDTFQWSKNATIVGVGSTAELPGMVTGNVTRNDMCRDLEALYFVAYTDIIYIRYDVAGLYDGWGTISEHKTWWGVDNPPLPGLRHGNVSMFVLYFDLDPGGTEGWNVGAGGDEINYSVGNQPDLYFQWDGTAAFISTLGQNPAAYYAMLVDNKSEEGITTAFLGGIEAATDTDAGAFEFAINRTQLESGVEDTLGFTEIENVDVWLMSFKPGESSAGGWGLWLHLFDPQAPATHGEDIYTWTPWWAGTWAGSVGPWPEYTWEDPWGVGHNLTTSAATAGMDGIDSVTGNPITLTYPLAVDFADVILEGGNNSDTFTFTPAIPWDTKATLTETAKIRVDLTATEPAPKGQGGPGGPTEGPTGTPWGLIVMIAAIAVLIVVPAYISIRMRRPGEKQIVKQ